METDASLTQFMMFENNSNVCWLDSSMTLIAHNKAIEKIAKDFPDSKLHQIIVMYNEAISILNDTDSPNVMENRVKTCKEMLLNIQASILQYLQPILKYEAGEPDSAFCALLNLVYENKSIKDQLSISWSWKKHCTNCGIGSNSSPNPKPIITLPKVNAFVPDCPTSIYLCPCKTEQEMKLVYKQLPPCLIFHFEQGAGNGNNLPLFFTIQERKYQLTCIIILEKGKTASVNHFVTFIRDPLADKWLECNDLNMDVINFSSEVPRFSMKDVYIFVFESFDNRGKLNNESTERSQEHDSGSSVELIDISDESVGLNTELKDNSTFVDTLNTIEKSVSDLTLKDGLHHSDEAIWEQKKEKSVLDLNLKDDLHNSDEATWEQKKEEKSVSDLTLKDGLHHSDEPTWEQKKLSTDVEKSDFINLQNQKIAHEKNHSEVSFNGACVNNKEIKKSNVSDFKYSVGNVRFIKRSSQIKSKKDFLRQQPISESESSLINRTKVENESKSSEIKTDRFHSDSSGFRNALNRTEKEDSLLSSKIDVPKRGPTSTSENSVIIRDEIESKLKTFQIKTEASYNGISEFKSYFKETENGDSILNSSNIDISKQRHISDSANSFICRDKIECKPKNVKIGTEVSHKESSNFEKNAAADLAFEVKRKLPDSGLPKSSESNSKSKFFDTNNLNGTLKLCCQKKNCSCDKSKDQCFSERKEDISTARKKIKLSQQLLEKSLEEPTLCFEDKQKTIPRLKVPKVIAYSKTPKNKRIGYNGHELELRMQHAMLKRSDSQPDCTITNLSKTNEDKSLLQKKSGNKSPKCNKKIEQMQESDIAEQQDLSGVNLGVNPEGYKAFPLDESVAVNQKRKSASKEPSSRHISSINSSSASSKNPSGSASSKNPSGSASSKNPSGSASSKNPSGSASSKSPSRRASSKSPSRRASSKSPSRNASSKSPSSATYMKKGETDKDRLDKTQYLKSVVRSTIGKFLLDTT